MAPHVARAQLALVTTWLLDIGPLVAYLDSRDPLHEAVSGVWDAFTGRLVTTSAVVTEAMHFFSASPKGPRYLLEVLTAAVFQRIAPARVSPFV